MTRRGWLRRLIGEAAPSRRGAAPIALVPPVATTLAPGTPLALLVEDEGALRKLAERVLIRAGWAVVAADCGKSALQLLANQSGSHGERPAVVISDVVMPGMDGLELVRAVRQVWPGLPAILVSGYAETALTHDLAAEGIAFLAKPYAPKDLVALVKRTAGDDSVKRS